MPNERINRLTAALQTAQLGGAVLMPDANLQYLTGLHFHPGKRLNLAIFPADGAAPALVLPAMELNQARNSTDLPFQFFPWADEDGPVAALAAALAAVYGPALHAHPLAIEHPVMRVSELRALEAATPNLQTVDATPIFTALRLTKDSAELALISEAVRILEQGLENALQQLRPGMSERAFSRLLTDALLNSGAEAESFPNLVASGPNGANPHHNNGDRTFQPGDLVIIDCGARYHGYISDITRTVAIGTPSPAAQAIYDLVLQANRAGCAASGPGKTGAEIDAAARNIITYAGYGEYFIHRTGHGIGIDVHEPPYIMAGNHTPLPVGATFTVEPGIYLPDQLGVRIEDNLVITTAGAQVLTTFPRELRIIPAESAL
jgi:Xaa-Pro aminopeptidase